MIGKIAWSCRACRDRPCPVRYRTIPLSGTFRPRANRFSLDISATGECRHPIVPIRETGWPLVDKPLGRRDDRLVTERDFLVARLHVDLRRQASAICRAH
ncbi:putative leader peptide [Longimycelium tulufanense]|uniref:putative leader peptide n=1 Tax=Longimycelium tulufanense TaxID=907463 RepID=UPI003570BF8F